MKKVCEFHSRREKNIFLFIEVAIFSKCWKDILYIFQSILLILKAIVLQMQFSFLASLLCSLGLARGVVDVSPLATGR